MTKGKYGLSLAAVAVLAFALMCIGSTEILLLLLVGYAVIIEKNDWLIRQTLQAFYLRLSYLVATSVLGWLFGFPFSFINRISGFSIAHSSLNTLLWLLLLGLGIYAVTRVVKEEDAEIPLINDLVHLTMGTFKRRSQSEYRQPPSPSAYTPTSAPVYNASAPASAPFAPASTVYSTAQTKSEDVEQTEENRTSDTAENMSADLAESTSPAETIVTPAPAAYTPAPAAYTPAPAAYTPAPAAYTPAPAAYTPAPAAYTPAPAAYTPAPAAYTPAPAAYTPAPAAYTPAPAAYTPAPAAYTPAPAAYTPAPAAYKAPAYTAPAPAAATNAWTCSCGASNAGNFCIHCGSPKK